MKFENFGHGKHFRLAPAASTRQQSTHPYQVQRTQRYVGELLDLPSAHDPCPPQAAHNFEPPEDLFVELAFALTHLEGRLPAALLIEPARPCPVVVLVRYVEFLLALAGDVRVDPTLVEFEQEFFGVVPLVCAERRRLKAQRALDPVQHLQGAAAFGVPVSLPHANIHAQSVTVLHEHMHAVLQVRHARGLGVQPRLRIGDASVRLVGALVATEVHPGIADPAARFVVILLLLLLRFGYLVASLRGDLLAFDLLETLERRMALQERSSHWLRRGHA